MDAFRIIELVEGEAAANGFKEYINGLSLKPEVKEKITVFDLSHPLYQHGFHPAMALHMLQYNEQLKSQTKI